MTGFPWNLWAYSWSWFIEVIQLLNILGLFAFNLIVITIFTIPAAFFFKSSFSKKTLILSTTFLFIISNYIFGTFLLIKIKPY